MPKHKQGTKMPDDTEEKKEVIEDAAPDQSVSELAPSSSHEQITEPDKLVGKSKRRKFIILGSAALVVIAASITTWIVLKNNNVPSSQLSQTEVSKKFGVAVGLTEGLVEYSADTKSWQNLKADTDLKEGDSVRTAADGRAVLLIDDGSAVRLNKNSELKLSSLNVESIVITNTAGEIYNRVVASETRAYTVNVGDETYKAKGTAYRTFNQETKKGVEVFHSTVEAKSQKTDVAEGNCLFSLHEQKDKEGTVLALDIEALRSDEFIKWNSEQDKKVAGYSDKLGVLAELDKPAPAAPKPAAAAATSGITLKGSQSEYSAVFSWTVSGVDTSKGFKLVRSKTSTTPTYPGDSAAFIESGKKSYALYVGDGKTYNYRICAYRDGGCEFYSNVVTVTTTKKVEPEVVSGPVTLSITDNVASWTFGGTAPHGFKIVVGTNTGPTYSNNYKKYFASDTHFEIPAGDLASGTTYYLRVCKYSNSGCVDYSNEVTYIP